MRAPRRNVRGVALLSILLIVAILAALASALVVRQSLVIAQARQTFTGNQSLQYALGGETYARQILADDLANTGEVDHLQEAWAQPLEPFELDNGVMEVQIRDLQGCFNLNVLAGEDADTGLARFKNLLGYLGLPREIADRWRDWVDLDGNVNGFGAEDGEYLLADQPHRTPNAAVTSVSELRLIGELDAEQRSLLESSVCVLPSPTLSLNVNSADVPALMALDAEMNPGDVEALVASERTFEAIDAVTSELEALAAGVDALRVTSEYFEVSVRAEVGGSVTELTSVVHRIPDGGLRILRRSFGKTFRSLYVEDTETAEGE